MPRPTMPRTLRALALLALLLAVPRHARAQEMARLAEQADSAESAGRFRAAGELYERAFAVSGEEMVLRYLAARAWARAGQPDRAFAALESVVRAGWPHAARTRADTLLVPLHADPRWAPLMAEADARAAALDTALRDELLRLAAEDQRVRAGIGAIVQRHGRASPQADSAFAEMAAADRPVQARLRAIVAGRGWPDRRLVADDGAHAAWLLLQHADSAFQREVLPAVRRAAADGNARLADAAYLEDRVLMAQGRPQRFGTQMRFDGATGRLSLYAIEDEARVDERRAAAGMGPLADYLAAQGIEYRVPGRKP